MFKITKRALILFFLILFFLLNGCATKANFNNTPTNNLEFQKDIKILKGNYSDIEKYDRFFASPTNAPEITELKKLWGNPREERRWGSYALGVALFIGCSAIGLFPYSYIVFPIVLMPTPSKNYIWEKGKYQIVAHGRDDIFVGYDERVHNWTWEEKKTK